MHSPEDRNNRGHIIVSFSGFYPREHKKDYDIYIKYLKELIFDTIKISKNHNKKLITIHVDILDCTMKNFSFTFFKKMNETVSNEFHDIVKIIYVYSNSDFLENSLENNKKCNKK